MSPHLNESASPRHQSGPDMGRSAATPAYYLQRPADVWQTAFNRRSRRRRGSASGQYGAGR